MYIEITTICNLLCPHCAWSRTSEGAHMPFELFTDIFEKIRAVSNGLVTLGGGEPLLHPDIEKIIDYCNFRNVEIITNGTTGNVLKIHEKVYDRRAHFEKGVPNYGHEWPVSLRVSFDRFREPLSAEVYQAFLLYGGFHFTTPGEEWRFTPFRTGRAVNLPLHDTIPDKCICPELYVNVSGDVERCGCNESPVIGHYTDPEIFKGSWHGCYKNFTETKEKGVKNDLSTFGGLPEIAPVAAAGYSDPVPW